LLSRKQYQQVFDKPERSSDDYFTLLAKLNDVKHARLGLAIAKKSIAHAVDRNRIKRLVRESFRMQQLDLGHADFVVLAKRNLQNSTNEQIRQSLNKHWERLVKKCEKS